MRTRATRRRSSRRRSRPAEQVEAAHAAPDEEGLHEIVADKGYHSNETMVDLAAVGLRSYISEPDRGRRDWSDAPDAQAPVYRNRRRRERPVHSDLNLGLVSMGQHRCREGNPEAAPTRRIGDE